MSESSSKRRKLSRPVTPPVPSDDESGGADNITSDSDEVNGGFDSEEESLAGEEIEGENMFVVDPDKMPAGPAMLNQVEFTGKVIHDVHYTGIKRLMRKMLRFGQLDVDLGRLAKIIIGQNNIGVVISQDQDSEDEDGVDGDDDGGDGEADDAAAAGADANADPQPGPSGHHNQQQQQGQEAGPSSDSDDDDDHNAGSDHDVFGINTVIPLRQPAGAGQRTLKLVKSLTEYLVDIASKANEAHVNTLTTMLTSPEYRVGFLISERIVNLPAALNVQGLCTVFGEVKRAAAHNKAPFNFTHFLVLAKTYRGVNNESATIYANEENKYMVPMCSLVMETDFRDEAQERMKIYQTEYVDSAKILIFPVDKSEEMTQVLKSNYPELDESDEPSRADVVAAANAALQQEEDDDDNDADEEEEDADEESVSDKEDKDDKGRKGQKAKKK